HRFVTTDFLRIAGLHHDRIADGYRWFAEGYLLTARRPDVETGNDHIEPIGLQAGHQRTKLGQYTVKRGNSETAKYQVRKLIIGTGDGAVRLCVTPWGFIRKANTDNSLLLYPIECTLRLRMIGPGQ